MTTKIATQLFNYAARIAALYGELPQVEAVALGGSLATDSADGRSDVDLYVYSHADVPYAARSEIAMSLGALVEVDNRFWELGDEWIDSDSGVHADVMFRRVEWLEDGLDRVLRRCVASIGYTTCIWHN
ncbi:MAG: nucleotidyltransferase domain-containing protein, partial [Chloroflexi bacterium]|nr:nucleotidyltransferase domain-containing protein [Chloroflexota bacterium]